MSRDNKDGLPTGKDDSVRHDVFDPHPAQEADGDKAAKPGGAKPPKDPGMETNSYVNAGGKLPKPKNDTAGT